MHSQDNWTWVICNALPAGSWMGHNQRTLKRREMSGMSRLPPVLPLNTSEISLSVIFVPACARTTLHFWILKSKSPRRFKLVKSNNGISSRDFPSLCICLNVHHSVWITQSKKTSGHKVGNTDYHYVDTLPTVYTVSTVYKKINMNMWCMGGYDSCHFQTMPSHNKTLPAAMKLSSVSCALSFKGQFNSIQFNFILFIAPDITITICLRGLHNLDSIQHPIAKTPPKKKNI